VDKCKRKFVVNLRVFCPGLEAFRQTSNFDYLNLRTLRSLCEHFAEEAKSFLHEKSADGVDTSIPEGGVGLLGWPLGLLLILLVA